MEAMGNVFEYRQRLCLVLISSGSAVQRFVRKNLLFPLSFRQPCLGLLKKRHPVPIPDWIILLSTRLDNPVVFSFGRRLILAKFGDAREAAESAKVFYGRPI
jgi:hypothetical protein